ncbi:MAG: hypothetical protein IPH07_22645 [Deltaproteobacteria bacterium]|nr:hypothetical protein [Deltaproteobacteria bacterium]MBK8714224.1 hypothetical protein [Deltaproteobacteria bacterium]MBP7285986.1 hypothetical protein [Nannocystaceae bacterium]
MSREGLDPWARFADAMTPRPSITDDGWRRLQAQLQAPTTAAIPLLARPRRGPWVVAVALAAATIAALSLSSLDDASQLAVRETAEQAVDDRVVVPPGGDAVARVAGAPAELPVQVSGAQPAAPAPVVPAARPGPRAGASVAAMRTASDPLAAEVALIDRIERALAARRVDAARGLLAQYHREIPNGTMAREAAMLAIAIACQDGSAAGIDAAVDDYAASFPDDAAVTRLRTQPCASASRSQ